MHIVLQLALVLLLLLGLALAAVLGHRALDLIIILYNIGICDIALRTIILCCIIIYYNTQL